MVYPKFKQKEECAYPERPDCNGDIGNLSRCEYMKYNNSKSIFDFSRWECLYKSESITTKDNNKLKGKTKKKVVEDRK